MTTTTLETWADLLALDPQLAGLDRVLADYKQRIKASNQWKLYRNAKGLLSRYVGWDAEHAPPELATSRAYEIGSKHICDELGI